MCALKKDYKALHQKYDQLELEFKTLKEYIIEEEKYQKIKYKN